jgi:AGZA family xanthine/uracil permease-like MFS transporter
LGYFGYLYLIIPKVTVYPILVFIGLEISAQSFHATPHKHYPAVVLACVPALAQLALIYVDKIFGDPALFAANLSPAALQGKPLVAELTTLRILAAGFIVTSLLWASALAAIIDRRLWRAGSLFLLCSVFTLFGIIHSPLPGSPMYLPWQLAAADRHHVYSFVAGYAAVALLFYAWGSILPPQGEQSNGHVY